MPSVPAVTPESDSAPLAREDCVERSSVGRMLAVLAQRWRRSAMSRQAVRAEWADSFAVRLSELGVFGSAAACYERGRELWQQEGHLPAEIAAHLEWITRGPVTTSA